MKKRFLSISLILALCLSLLPATALAEESNGLCEHHTAHDDTCGYVAEEQSCNFECNECEKPSITSEQEESDVLKVQEYSWSGTKLSTAEKTITEGYTKVDKATDFGTAGTKWKGTYYVREDVEIDAAAANAATSGTIDFEGDVTLIIAPR